jgi:hypothetical protein
MTPIQDTPLFVGVAREPVYSPGKIDADRAILEATGRACEARGARVRLLPPDAPFEAFAGAELVFAMCQGPKALRLLRRLAAAGLPLLHVADAIEACHRTRMLERLAAAGLPRPDARAVATRAPQAAALAWAAARAGGVWVKRGDVHATEPGDVVHACDATQIGVALARLAARGVPRAVLEAHVEGRTLKFYGVRGGGFFRAYEGDGSETASRAAWRELGERAATALGLEVYGGDLVLDPHGPTVLVDVNDWPSFGRCREEAAAAIADRLFSRLARREGGEEEPGDAR